MKKHYNKPKLVLIGDMMHNTLGASGPATDSGGQAQANGQQTNNTGFDNQGFDNNGFSG